MYRLTRVVMDKDPLNGCVSVCVVYAMSVVFVHCHIHYVKTVERIELEFWAVNKQLLHYVIKWLIVVENGVSVTV